MAQSATAKVETVNESVVMPQYNYAISEVEDIIERVRYLRSLIPDEGMEARRTMREHIFGLNQQLKDTSLSRLLSGIQSKESAIAGHKSRMKLWKKFEGKLNVKLDSLNDQAVAVRHDKVTSRLIKRQADGVRDVLERWQSGVPEIIADSVVEVVRDVFGEGPFPTDSFYNHLVSVEELEATMHDALQALDRTAATMEKACVKVEKTLTSIFGIEVDGETEPKEIEPLPTKQYRLTRGTYTTGGTIFMVDDIVSLTYEQAEKMSHRIEPVNATENEDEEDEDTENVA